MAAGEAEAVKIHIFLQIFFTLIVCLREALCVCVMCIQLLRLTGLLMAQHSMVIWLSKQRMAVFLQGNGLWFHQIQLLLFLKVIVVALQMIVCCLQHSTQFILKTQPLYKVLMANWRLTVL